MRFKTQLYMNDPGTGGGVGGSSSSPYDSFTYTKYIDSTYPSTVSYSYRDDNPNLNIDLIWNNFKVKLSEIWQKYFGDVTYANLDNTNASNFLKDLFQCKEAYIPFYDRKNLKFVITYSSSHAYKILQIKFRDDKFSSCVEDLSLYFNISVYRLKSKEDTAVSYYDGDNGDFKLPIDVSSESSFFNISDISEIGIGSKPNRLFHSGSLYIADDGYRVLDSNSNLAIPFFPSDEYLEKCMLYKVLSNDNTYYFCGFKSSTYNNKTTPFKFNTNNPSITGLSHLNSDNGLYSAKDLGFSSYNYNLLYTGEKDSLYSPTTYIRIKAEYDTYSYADNLERYILTVEELDSSNNTLGKRIYHVYGNRQIWILKREGSYVDLSISGSGNHVLEGCPNNSPLVNNNQAMTLGDQALWVCDKNSPMIIAGNATAKYKQYVEFSMKEINNYGGIIIYPKTIKSINGTVINTWGINTGGVRDFAPSGITNKINTGTFNGNTNSNDFSIQITNSGDHQSFYFGRDGFVSYIRSYINISYEYIKYAIEGNQRQFGCNFYRSCFEGKIDDYLKEYFYFYDIFFTGKDIKNAKGVITNYGLHTFIGNADNNLSYGANINTHSLSGNYAYETAPADLSLRGIKKPYTFYMDSGIKYLNHNRIFLGVFFGDTQSRPFGFNPTLSHMDIDSIPLNSTRDDGAITIFLCDE